jgi:hypothetical protein
MNSRRSYIATSRRPVTSSTSRLRCTLKTGASARSTHLLVLSGGLRPREVLEEGAPHRAHLPFSQASRNARTHDPQIGVPFWKKRCPSSAVSPKGGKTRAA